MFFIFMKTQKNFLKFSLKSKELIIIGTLVVFYFLIFLIQPVYAGCEGYYSCKGSGILSQNITTSQQNGKNYVTITTDACVYSYGVCRKDIYPFVQYTWKGANAINFNPIQSPRLDMRNAQLLLEDTRCAQYANPYYPSPQVYRYSYTFEFANSGYFTLYTYSLILTPNHNCKDDLGAYDDITREVNITALVPVNSTLNVSCLASPSSIQTGQSTTFISSVSGGAGSYNYSWSGACTGSTQNCSNSFPNTGTYTATVNVTSGNQTESASCSVTVNQSNINHAYKQCYNNDVYWYDSQGNRQEIYQDCGDDSWTSNYQCSGSWLQRQMIDRGCSNALCYENNIWQFFQDCASTGQVCQNNQCASYSTLNVSCSASPNPANTNQTVTFNSSASGGTGSYTYSWSNACTGSSQSCNNSFSNTGTYTATVFVTSGTQTASANCPVNVNQSCTSHSYKQCYSDDLYWYDSCSNRQEIYQDCGEDGWTGNYQCLGNWLQRQMTDRGCSSAACYETNSWSSYQYCSQGCQNNQCASYSTLNVSCSASPNPANTNQAVNFNSSASGGTGSYTYSWSGVCTGSSQSCANSFSSTGTHTAYLTVTSGSQSSSVTCSVSVIQPTTNHHHLDCYNNDVYWYDSQGNRQEIYQDCGDDYWLSSYQCSGSAWLQRSKSINWCSNGSCTQSTRFDNYQNCSAAGQTCQNNQCGSYNYNNYLSCYNNDVYWFDSYGNRQGLYQDCGDSYCEGTGYNYCSGNSVYQQRTCYNRGCAGSACYSTTSYSDTRLIQTCGSGQTCQNGYCTNTCECTSGSCCDGCHYKSSSNTCNSETQTEYGCPWGSACGSDVGIRTKIRYQFCPGYSASCTGSWGNWSGLSDWRVVDYCSNEETCVYGNPACQPKTECVTSGYISHYTKKCYDNDLYWYDSLNVRQEKYRDCQDTNDCTIDSCSGAKCVNELKCDGTTCVVGSANYCSSCEYCGDKVCNCGETMASCSQDCSVIGLAVTIFGKKENDPVQWLKTFSASAGQKLDFLIVVSNGQEGQMNNVFIKTDLPQEIIYKGDFKLDGISFDGDIRTGVNLGTLAPKTVKTLTFKGEITGPDNISRAEVDATAFVNTSSGSSSDNIKINLLKEGQQIVVKSEGFLAGLLGTNFNKPIYLLLGIFIAILLLLGFVKVIRVIQKKE